MTEKQKIVAIVGPTASGKTSLAIELAKRFEGEVISADSRQIYRGLDIGTEKISEAEMEGIPHHLIDVAPPSTVYTAADFRRDAENAISTIIGHGKLPIIAGGTFFYIDALLRAAPLPEVAPDPELRKELEQLPAPVLFNALARLDPKRAETIDPHNKRRLMRALEIVKGLGSVPEVEHTRAHDRYDILWIGIQTDKDTLRARIRTRAKQALKRGLIEETKQLMANGVSRERLEEIGLEYAVVLEYLDGSLTDDQLVQKLEEKNWQYAKRQRMWLKRNEQIEWFAREDEERIAACVVEFLS